MSNNLIDQVEVKKGIALIVNNHTFWKKQGNEKLHARIGSEKDVTKLKILLENYGFTVPEPIIDGTEADIKEKVKTLADELINNKEKYDLVLVAVMTHGEDGGFLTDKFTERYNVKDIWDPFAQVKHIPKVFIFQTCRGAKSDAGQKVLLPQHQEMGSQPPNQESQAQDNKKTIKPAERVNVIPNIHDALVAYATIEAFYAWRCVHEGAYFITSFVAAVNENETNGKVELTDVFKSTARLLATYTVKVNGNEYKQTSTFVSSFTKKYFLVKPSTPPSNGNVDAN